jgi:hypothetical protein
MISWLLGRAITKFERDNDYDASYLRDLLEVSPEALIRFGLAGGLGAYRHDVPLDVYYAVTITAAMRADCGPCVQLVVGFAERDGVDPALLRAVVRRDLDALEEPVGVGIQYAEAVLSRSMEMDALRERLEGLFGPRAVVSLAFGILTSQLYPTLKYALGHGKSCVAVRVAGERVLREAATKEQEVAVGAES